MYTRYIYIIQTVVVREKKEGKKTLEKRECEIQKLAREHAKSNSSDQASTQKKHSSKQESEHALYAKPSEKQIQHYTYTYNSEKRSHGAESSRPTTPRPQQNCDKTPPKWENPVPGPGPGPVTDWTTPSCEWENEKKIWPSSVAYPNTNTSCAAHEYSCNNKMRV